MKKLSSLFHDEKVLETVIVTAILVVIVGFAVLFL
jgi:hypothetical protein